MKNFSEAAGSSLKQSGFFDLGISLLILAMAGSTVYVTERDHDEKMASMQENTITVEAETSDERMPRLASDTPGFSVE